jgi:tripartite-type tricarboxylate transporter receptor subunit TctC
MIAKLRFALLGGLLSLGLSAQASADDIEQFYTDNNEITVLVGQGPGSSFDSWARLVGRHMTKYLPGHPTFVVKQMPGAGTLVLVNHLYNSAPKDGTVIASFSASIPTQVLMGIDNAEFDPRKFGYIGSPEQSNHACAIATASGIKSVDDAMAKEVTMGASGPTTAGAYAPPLINNLIGTKFKVIDGYQGAPEVYLAMDRGEVVGQCAKLDSMLRNEGDKIKSGAYKILFTLNEDRSSITPDIPSLFELIQDPEKRELLSFIRTSTRLGRPFAAPPGIPEERLAALRKAFDETMTDQEFLDEAKTMKFEVTATTGQQLQDLVNSLFQTPDKIVQEAKVVMPQGAE